MDDIKKALATANEEASHALAERTRLDLEQKGAAQEGKREQDSLTRHAKEYSNELKRCKRAEVQLQTSHAQVGRLETGARLPLLIRLVHRTLSVHRTRSKLARGRRFSIMA